MPEHAPGRPEPFLVVGETDWRGEHRRFGMRARDRLRHAWLIGKTGTGKSTLLANLIRQDLAAGEGLAVLDPHGDLIDAVLPFVPRERTNDVLMFAPEDRAFPVSFNVFRAGRRAHTDHALLTSQLIALFRKQWADSWGPRLEHVLRNAILAVAPDPRATLLFLYRFLTDADLRERVVARVEDPVVRQFWEREFVSYGRTLQGEALAPALNKLGAFVANPVIRNIVAQERSRVDLSALVDGRGILLAKLPVGAIGEDAAHLLGGLLLTGIQLAAMARRRADPPFWVYVDEFHNFTNGSLATLLSESRKFGLGLALAHQYLDQLPDPVRAAVLGNIGTILCFRVGSADAAELEAEFAPELAAGDLERLPRYRLAVRLLADGESLRPFSARTLAPRSAPPWGAHQAERVERQSRGRFALPRAHVESTIRRGFAANSGAYPAEADIRSD